MTLINGTMHDTAHTPLTGRAVFTPTAVVRDGSILVAATPVEIPVAAGDVIDTDVYPTDDTWRYTVEVYAKVGQDEKLVETLRGVVVAGTSVALSDLVPALPPIEPSNADLLSARIDTAQADADAALVTANAAVPADARGKITPAAVQDQGSSAMRTFKAALAATRTGGACDILVIGDSITEGTGPATVEGRWASRFRNDLRKKFGVTGGRGYVPSQYGISPTPASQPWAYGGGATFPTGTYGLGKRIVRLNASGNTATLTTPVGTTDVDVFITCSTAVTCWFSYTIDGVAGTSPASPVNVQALSSATLRDVVIPLATGLDPSTTHTIVLTWSVGNVYLTGAMLYGGDKTTGIRLWDGARHGKDSLYFANATEPWNLTMNTIQPDLVIIELGTNDWSAKSQTPAQMRTNLEALIGSVRAQCTVPPAIILMPVYERLGSTSPLATWPEYVAAQKALAADDGDVAVLDLDKRMGVINSAATNNLGLLIADLTHPTDRGSQMISDALMDFVSYPIPA